MKKVFLALIVLAVTSPLYAMPSFGSSQNQGQAQCQGQGQIQASSNINKNISKSSSVASAVSLQGQVSDQSNSQGVSVGGDSIDSVAFAAGSLTNTTGTSGLNAGTPWGNIAVGNTEQYEVLNTMAGMVKTFSDSDLIGERKAKRYASKTLTYMEFECKPDRFLGFLWKTSGCNLFNGFGILSCKSFRDE